MNWINAKMKLPLAGEEVLVYLRSGKMKVAKWTINHRWEGARAGDITHWMPLPEPPET